MAVRTSTANTGAPMRAIQEWLGHPDSRTTSLYADYAPDPTNGLTWTARAFGSTNALNPITSQLRLAFVSA